MNQEATKKRFHLFNAFRAGATLHENLMGTGWLLILWSYVSLCLTQSLEWHTLAPGILTLLLGTFFSRSLGHLSAGHWWTISLFVLMAVLAEFFIFKNFFFDAAMHLIFYLQLNRFCTARKTSDFAQLYILTLLPILGCTALTIALSFMLTFTIFGILSIIFFLVLAAYQQSSESERKAPGKLMTPYFWSLTGVSAVLLMLCTVIIFVSIPRASLAVFFNNWNIRPGSGSESTSGFTDKIQWGQTEKIRLDFQKAFFAKIPEGTPVPIDPYWRAVSLDRYTRNGWEISEEMDAFVEMRPLDAVTPYPTMNLYSITIYLEPNTTSYLISPPGSNYLRTTRAEIAAVNKETGSIKLRSPPKDVYSYQLFFALDSQRPRNRRINREVRKLHLDLPYEEGQITELKDFVTRATGSPTPDDPRQIAQRIQTYLRTNFTYSLDLDQAGKNDPILFFLKTSRRGHCEFFAGSMVLMLRASNIPARIVTGYRGGEWNQSDRYFTVRQSDAHAWVEAYIEGQGWVQYDPTPAVAFNITSDWLQGIKRQFTRLNDKVSFFWYQQVVNYNLHDQLNLLRSISLKSNASIQIGNFEMPALFKNFSFWRDAESGKKFTVSRLLLFLTLIFAASLILAVYLLMTKWIIPSLSGRGKNALRSAEAIILWKRVKNLLRAKKVALTDSDTPWQIYDKSRFFVPDPIAFHHLTLAYCKLRFARDVPDDLYREFKELSERVQKGIQSMPPQSR